MGKDEKKIKAGKGKPKKGAAKTTIKTVPPPEITPNKPELVVVLDKTGAVPAKYPILEFDIQGPPSWFCDVQVSRKDADKLTAGPGLAGAWDKSKTPKDRLPQRLFSSWTNGEKTLKLDGSGKAKYKMPLDWWKDLARLPRKDFTTEDFYYRVLAFKDAAASSIVYSTKNTGTPPSVKIHNNLTDFKFTDLGYVSGGLNKSVQTEFIVREADTTEMYTIVQWNIGSNRIWGGGNTYASATDYGISHRINIPEWAIDRLRLDPRYQDGVYTIAADKKTAATTDTPGGPIGASDTHDYYSLDFETRLHLNFEVPAAIKIKRKDGSPPIYDVVIGVLDDPQPFILDSATWNVRILQVRQADGTVTVTHPNTFAGP